MKDFNIGTRMWLFGALSEGDIIPLAFGGPDGHDKWDDILQQHLVRMGTITLGELLCPEEPPEGQGFFVWEGDIAMLGDAGSPQRLRARPRRGNWRRATLAEVTAYHQWSITQ